MSHAVSEVAVSRRLVLTGSVVAGALAVTPAATAAPGTLTLASGKIRSMAGSVRFADQGERASYYLSQRETTESWDALPFHQFEVPLTGKSSTVRIAWKGRTNPGARLRLMVWAPSVGGFEEVAHSFADAQGKVSFDTAVESSGRAVAGALRVLIQHSVGFAGNNRSFRYTPTTHEHPEDTQRATYDFTLAWETDTQFYNESFTDRQRDIHDYLLRNRDKMNIQYVFHTGDIVDEYFQPHQFANADPQYKRLDDAAYPYGILAGNHDVLDTLKNLDYSTYEKFFGASRYAANPWYGGTYKNNRGHYDLISAGSHDFLMLYMGWGAETEEIAWMNKVLQQYPERTAIIALHQYIDPQGKLAETPQRIKDEVVAVNKNVRMVIAGHHHGALVTQDTFGDRKVTNILFDFQSLPEGGQSFLRLLHFDNYNGVVTARTYSPYLKTFNSQAIELPAEHQDFTISYADLGLKMKKKTLTTQSLRVSFL